MSYSFQVKAGTKTAAAVAVEAELDKVMAQQPIHAKDRVEASAAARLALGVIADDPAQDVVVYLSGSVSWAGTGDDAVITSCNISASASLTARVAPAS